MEEENRPEIEPASSNLVVPEFCRFDSTRSNSGSASSLTAENMRDTLHPDANARPDKCVSWTDEKHNKYLDSLEASFVQQLRGSRDLLAWCTEENRSDKDSSQRLPVSVPEASEQFAVLQDVQLQKIIFKKDQHLSYLSTIKIPVMHSQRSAGKDSFLVSADKKECNELPSEEEHLERKRAFSRRSASCSGQNPISNLCYHNSVGIIKEGSGQNFVDEDSEDNPSGSSLGKRLKTAAEDSSSEDQIVPSA